MTSHIIGRQLTRFGAIMLVYAGLWLVSQRETPEEIEEHRQRERRAL
jgi:hypothetical protein